LAMFYVRDRVAGRISQAVQSRPTLYWPHHLS
jgi:hypothetical protein